MFSADQLIAAMHGVLTSRGVRVARQCVRCEMIGGIQHVGFGLTSDYGVQPSESEWVQLMAGMETLPPLPQAAYRVWGHPRDVAMSRDGVARIQFVASLVMDEDKTLLRRMIGTGSRDLAGLSVAMAEAIRFLAIPLHQKTLWLKTEDDV